tara:strand:- start:4677 stop:6047 length:1371 start_codon:yes stop_codon:yes gene_type:complete
MNILSTNHPTLLKFYKEHPNIDFETVNIMLVQLLENIFNANDSIEKTSADKIFNSINDLQSIIEIFKSTQELKDKSLYDNITLSMNNMKNDYTGELSRIIENKHELSKHEFKSSVQSVIDSQNELMQNNIKLMLHEQFPKNNDLIVSLQPMLDKFQETNKELIVSLNSSNSTSKQDMDLYVERINNNFNNYQTLMISRIDTIHNSTSSFQEFMNKYQNSSLKGQFGENKLSSVLNETFTTGEIINTSGTKCSCDYLLKRESMSDIYFENKDYSANVGPKEVKKFIRDIEEQNSHGIFLSQSSGITSKSDYHIDIHKNNVLVYLHNVNFSGEKIKTAVDIIDHLSSRIDNINTENGTIENIISQEDLESINKEYNDFISNKSNLIQLTRDYQKKINEHINLLDLPNIEKYLNSKFAKIQSSDFVCDICNKWKGTNLKSLAAHKRSCKNKNQTISIET